MTDDQPAGDRVADALVRSLLSTCRDVIGDRPAKEAGAPAPPRAFAWARVSTNSQEAKGLSIPQQLREMRAYARRHGIELVQEFSETASAFNDYQKRIEFHRMLAAALTEPRPEMILVHEHSRFSRDSLKGAVIVEELRRAGVAVVSVTDPPVDGRSPIGVYTEAVSFAKGEAYSRELSLHIRKALRANLQTRDPVSGWCYKNGGPGPMGFLPVPVTVGVDARSGRPITKQLWVLDERPVRGKPVYEWVRHCLLELAGRGARLQEIRDLCEEVGLPSRGDRPGIPGWRRRLRLQGLLLYAGCVVWGAGGDQDLSWPPVGWGIVERAHPAIITLEQALRIARIRQTLCSERGGASARCPYLSARGLTRCGRCGHTMGMKGRGYLYCSSRAGRGSAGSCSNDPHQDAAVIDQILVAALQEAMDALLGSSALATANAELRESWRDAFEQPAEARPGGVLALTRLVLESADVAPASGMVARPVGTIAPLNALGKLAPQQTPAIDRRAVRECVAQTRRVLEGGGLMERKYWVRAWVERATIDPIGQVLSVTFNLPAEAVSPPAASRWCTAHSAALSQILTCSFPLSKLKLPPTALDGEKGPAG